jgi:hypothetical protein
MQIGGKCIKYLLVNMLLKKTFNSQIWKDTCFHADLVGNELTNSDLELSNVWQLEEPKVVLPKLIPMNHCQEN